MKAKSSRGEVMLKKRTIKMAFGPNKRFIVRVFCLVSCFFVRFAFVGLFSCSCFPLGECLRRRSEQVAGDCARCRVSLHLCPQRRRCRYQASLFLFVQGKLPILFPTRNSLCCPAKRYIGVFFFNIFSILSS